MTKLFSIKSLACAGAAAFALTLAAAPQASAATPLKLTPTVDYSTGTLTVKGEGDDVTKYVVTTADGKGIYLGSGKNASKLKYELISDANTGNAIASGLKFDVSKFIGKETTIGVALDQEGTTAAASVTLVAAPKVKAKVDGNDIKINVDGSDVAKGLADKDFKGYTYQYKVGTYGDWKTMSDDSENTPDAGLTAAVTAAKNFGTTMYVRVAKFGTPSGGTSKVQLSPWSKEAKVKVTAKAKAPKINIKTAALTKAFEWKMGAKVEYKVTVGGKTTYWTVGGDKADWSKIISAAVATTKGAKEDDLSTNKLSDVTNLVKGDAIANNVTIQLRTAATDKKDASKISVLELKASPNSPTCDQIKVAAVQASKKNATASAAAITPASIPTGYAAQYSLDSGKTWKNLKKEVRIESDKLNNKTVDLRLVGSDKKKIDLPSAVTTVIIPTNGTTGSTAISEAAEKDAALKATVIYRNGDSAVVWTVKDDVADYTKTTKEKPAGA